MYDFPSSPTIGQVYVGPGGVEYRWNGYGWVLLGEPGPQGEQGEPGPQGPMGPPGPQGAAGTGINMMGSVPTEGDLPAGAAQGDAYIVEATGDLWSWTGTEWVNLGPMQGPAGPAGPQGPKGDTGTAGAQGPKGDTGNTGPAGADGAQGPKGEQGLNGAQGPPGPASTVPGPAGPQGPAGTTGAQGIQGVKGDPGAAGPAGTTGAQGPKGDTGSQGVPGATGTQGPPGIQGPEGVQGPKGDKGDTGATGPAGAGVPAGADTQVQFNDAGAFGGDAGLTYNKTTDLLTVTGGVALGTTKKITGTQTTAIEALGGAYGDARLTLMMEGTTAGAVFETAGGALGVDLVDFQFKTYSGLHSMRYERRVAQLAFSGNTYEFQWGLFAAPIAKALCVGDVRATFSVPVIGITATPGTNDTKLATTAFVTAAVAAGGGGGGGLDQATADARYVNVTGDTVNGALTVNGNVTVNGLDSEFVVDDSSPLSEGNAALFAWKRSGQPRWRMFLDGSETPGPGSVGGSDWTVARYRDDGTWIDNPFKMARNTGEVRFSHSAIVQGTFDCEGQASFLGYVTLPPDAPTNPQHATNKAYVDTALAGKAPTVHTHTTAQVTGLDTALAGKEPSLPAGGTTTTWLRGDKSWQPLPAPVFPAGVLMPFAGTAAPAGFLLCYGQTVSRTTYSLLFTAIGTAYATGGEAGTDFRLPDLRGRVAAGKDNMGGTAANRVLNTGGGNPGIDGTVLGAAGGVDRHAITILQMPQHNHGISDGVAIGASGTVAGRIQPNSGTVYVSASAGGNDAHPNMQPTMMLNYLISTGGQ